MDDRQNNAEQEFFQWLPSAVSPSALKDIQTSYIQINALLVKSRVLLRPIVNVTSIRQIEVALQQAKMYWPISISAILPQSFLWHILSIFAERMRCVNR